jgi:hypothetical protein
VNVQSGIDLYERYPDPKDLTADRVGPVVRERPQREAAERLDKALARAPGRMKVILGM